MANLLDAARAEMSSGRFLAALSILRNHGSDNDHTASLAEQAVLAEALQLTGKSDYAETAAQGILRSTKRTPFQEAQALRVLSRIAFERGQVGESLRTFQRARKRALVSRNLAQACRIRLDLITNLSDLSGASSIASTLGECEREVAELGHPDLQARLHITIAQIEGKRGLLQQAESHLRSAQTILASYPNHWLEGLLFLNLSTIRALRMKAKEGLELAEKALKCALASGHRRTRLGAIGNLAFLHLSVNNLAAARRYCEDGLRLSGNISDVRIALLETMAQVTLANRQSLECRKLLAEIDQIISTDERFRLSWYALATVSTRARLHHQDSNWQKSLDDCQQGIALESSKSDRLHQISLRVLGADALIELGHFNEAAVYIKRASELAENVPFAVFAELERVRAAFLLRTTGSDAARRQFERSLRLLSAVGGIAPRMDAGASYQRTVRPDDEKLRHLVETRPWDLDPLVKPTQPTKSRENPADSARDGQAPIGMAMTDAVSLSRLVGRPDLLAQEAFILLRESGHTAARAIVERARGRVSRVIAHEGWSAQQARRTSRRPQEALTIPLGTMNERELELRVEPRDNVEADGFLRDFETFLQQSRSLQSFRDAERAQNALLSADARAGDEDGIFIAESMRKLLQTVKQVAKTNDPVLIVGETGTGKEVVARLIHKYSARSKHDFVAFNSTGVPHDMVESQLFGHRRGAFTGANEAFPGVIRDAKGGTLLLDEIGELDAGTQPKLLRFLENSEIQPLGESRPIRVDVRVVAATNADLDARVRRGQFREDLLYRLNIITLEVPPLRTRREEILPLVQHFLQHYGEEQGRPGIRVTEEAQKCLLVYGWPGNVRQLESEIRRAIALASDDRVIGLDQLSPDVLAAGHTLGEAALTAEAPGPTVTIRTDQPLASAVQELEQAMIRQALRTVEGHVGLGAELLGISRKGFYLKRQRFGIDGVA